MKSIIRSFLTFAAGLFLTSWIVPGFEISKNIQTFVMIAGSLMLASFFIKPLLKIIFMPINIATFGLFSIVINAIILYGLDYFFGGLRITEWTFDGFTYNGFIVPQITFGIIATYLLSGLVIGVLLTLVKWLVDE
jgi:putative membrane protein